EAAGWRRSRTERGRDDGGGERVDGRGFAARPTRGEREEGYDKRANGPVHRPGDRRRRASGSTRHNYVATITRSSAPSTPWQDGVPGYVSGFLPERPASCRTQADDDRADLQFFDHRFTSTPVAAKPNFDSIA